ncbi:MAG: T9SS type A sorting domain-containing protein, partial [candidate division KSB1 bacterium]|nr:T9SS type A sorting domain-containing protein [candidate division KSB1 bacterium]
VPGKLSFLLKGNSAISDSGTLCFIQLQVIGLPGTATRLHFQGIQFYPDTLIGHGRNSTLTVAGGTSPGVSVFIPDLCADTAATITVPVYISDVTNKAVTSVSMALHFRSQVLQYIGSNLTNSILAGWMSMVNVKGDTIRLGAFGATDLTGQGLLAEFTFLVIGRPAMQSGLTFLEMMLNEGEPSVMAYDGLVTVNYVIPVELAALAARVNGRDVVLTWETATETNNYGFGIERWSLESNWQQIGFVPGAGTTIVPQGYAFTDKSLNAGAYYYRLRQIDFDGQFHYSQTISVIIGKPDRFQLFQNYPNPFNATTAIRFDLPERSNIRLVLFDVSGRQVALLAAGEFPAGQHQIIAQLDELSSGVYFYQLKTKNFSTVKKLLHLK